MTSSEQGRKQASERGGAENQLGAFRCKIKQDSFGDLIRQASEKISEQEMSGM